MNDEFTALIERYLNDELTREERSAFEERRATDDAFRREVEAYEKTLRIVRLKGRQGMKARLAGQGRQLDSQKKSPVYRLRRWMGLALLAIAFLAWWFWGKKTGPPATGLPTGNIQPDSVRTAPPSQPDTILQRPAVPGNQPIRDESSEKPPVAQRPSANDRLFAAYFQPFKDETLEPSVRGEGNATPEEIFLQYYWDGKYQAAMAAFDNLEPASKNKGDLQFLQANCLLATGHSKPAISILKNLGRTRFQAAAKWLLALAYLKNEEIARAKAQLEQIAGDTTSPKQSDAARLLKELE